MSKTEVRGVQLIDKTVETALIRTNRFRPVSEKILMQCSLKYGKTKEVYATANKRVLEIKETASTDSALSIAAIQTSSFRQTSSLSSLAAHFLLHTTLLSVQATPTKNHSDLNRTRRHWNKSKEPLVLDSTSGYWFVCVCVRFLTPKFSCPQKLAS